MNNNVMPVLDFLKAADGLLTDVCAYFYTHYLKGNQEANNNLMLFFQNAGRRDNEQPYYVRVDTKSIQIGIRKLFGERISIE